MTGLFPPGPRARQELSPGAVHIPDWLTPAQQRHIVAAFQQWAAGPVPIRAATVNGHQMSVRTVCLGWHWRPYVYTRTADDVNGARVLDLPDWLVELGWAAVADAYGDAEAGRRYAPDTALVNFYDRPARMGMHQDRDEVAREPVVSLSVGDSCLFRFGNTENRGKPYRDIMLVSGDLFVFGGPARLAFHAVPKLYPGTAPDGCGLAGGRINITMRVTGMA